MLKNSGVVLFVATALNLCSICLVAAQDNSSAPLQDSFVVDPEGNRYGIRKMPDNNLWMTVNLKLKSNESYCYGNAEENCRKYGRLYTWEAANTVCHLLGDGWSLPTKEDWLQLTRFYGFSKDSVLHRKEVYQALLYTGTSGFDALLGGGRAPDSQYARLEAHGFYWTATETGPGSAVYYNFARGSAALYQQVEGEKPRAFSVRCIKK